jgi:hypothetical protein
MWEIAVLRLRGVYGMEASGSRRRRGVPPDAEFEIRRSASRRRLTTNRLGGFILQSHGSCRPGKLDGGFV